MSDFSYKLPDKQMFGSWLIESLATSGYTPDKELAEILKNAAYSFEPSSTFTRKRWNEYHCRLVITIDSEKFRQYVQNDSNYDLRLECVANKLFPDSVGYLLSVKVHPSEFYDNPLATEVSTLITQHENPIFSRVIDDLQMKGKEMGEIYIAIYYIENSLRHFIDEVFKEKYGEEYSLNDYLSDSTVKSITDRKKKDERNKWLDKRGNSALYYLDFTDIICIINKNWNIYVSYFPDQNWLKVKLDEISLIRNLVAHNSYVSSDGRQIVLMNYKQIMEQIRDGNNP